jgi:hypothetical protein
MPDPKSSTSAKSSPRGNPKTLRSPAVRGQDLRKQTPVGTVAVSSRYTTSPTSTPLVRPLAAKSIPQGRGNGTRGRGPGRAQQPHRFYCLFHGEDCAHPTRDCPETKATRDWMSRAQPADNPRVVAHTYQQLPQPYNHGPAQLPPNHAYPHHQEVQIVPPPPPPPHPQQPKIHHPNHPQAPKREDFADQPYHGVIHMITGGSSIDFDTKRQKRDHYRSINHVAVTGPVVQTKWSHVPLTFDARDVDLRSAPHIDAMVINCSVAGWDLHKVLVDNGSQADIIFLHAFDRMGISHILLKPSDNPLYGFGGKGTFPVGKIELPLSFGVAPNARSEQVTFDIVDMVYPYNAIMGWGSINKFEAAIHGLYLCMKIPGPQGAIIVYGNQQAAHNIEIDFVPGQRNVHYLTAQREVPESASPTAKEHEKAQLQSNDGTKTVPLDQATLSHPVLKGKPNANYVRARIRTHVHSDYINEHHHTMLE